jgi:hypothetical protein
MSLANRLTGAFGAVLATLAAGASATYAFDGHTAHAWKRTFYAYNAFEQPLRPYFIPRQPGNCAREECCTDSAGCYPPSAAAGFEPLRFERLGHIPNDLTVGAAADR